MPRIPTIHTQLQVFHAPHEEERDFRPFTDYLIQLQESVKRHLFNELPLEKTLEREIDDQFVIYCPFCHKNFAKGVRKVRYHAHVSGGYSNGVKVKHYEAGQYIIICCNKCNLQLSFNKKNYRLPVYFHNGSHYDFTFNMKLIASTEDNNGNLEVIPTTKDKEMQIEFRGIQFKESLKLIRSPLKTIVAQTLCNDLEHYIHTRTLLGRNCEKRDKQWNDEYIDLLTRKEPIFYRLIKSYESLKYTVIPSHEQCIDDMKGEMMSKDEYDHIVKLWLIFDINTWGECYELYNVLDVTLMADAFEHFRNTTLNVFGVDLMHYITAPQMANSLFLKVTMEGDHSKNALKALGEKWVQYIIRINTNKGLTEKNLEKIFMNRMGEFYGNKGIRLMEKNEIDDFIRLLKNPREKNTQIVKGHAKVDLDNKE